MSCIIFKKYACEYVWPKLKHLPGVIFSRSFALAIGLGQMLSLLICGTAVTSGLLEKESVFMPTGQSFFTYVLLSVTFTSWMCCAGDGKTLLTILKDRGWKYFFLALIDVEATYLVVKAYQFTSVTSVQLLDCVTIPTVLILSWKLLSIRYKWSHLVGVVACLLGAFSLVLADHLTEKSSGERSNTLLGDVLVVAGAILYGISNISQEFMVSKHGKLEYLGCFSFFGSLISGVQFVILERQEITSIDFSARILLPLFGYVACLFLLYALMPYVIVKIGAMAVNLNLLSSDFLSLLIGLYVFQYKFHALYFMSFGLITFGLIAYNVYPPVTKDSTVDAETVDGNSSSIDPKSVEVGICGSTNTLVTDQRRTEIPNFVRANYELEDSNNDSKVQHQVELTSFRKIGVDQKADVNIHL